MPYAGRSGAKVKFTLSRVKNRDKNAKSKNDENRFNKDLILTTQNGLPPNYQNLEKTLKKSVNAVGCRRTHYMHSDTRMSSPRQKNL